MNEPFKATFKTRASREMGAQARRAIPGGVNSNFRKDSSFQPIFFARGEGAHLYDADGNKYIDYALSYGPAILGHSNAHYQRALCEQIERLSSPETTDLEYRAAEKIIAHVPCAEQVRFASTGSEANYNALRIARAHTGRTKVVRFNGHYHGSTDELMGGISTKPFSAAADVGELPDDLFSQACNTQGRPSSTLWETFLLKFNDLPAAERLFEQSGQDIAAVLLEPVMLNNFGCTPAPGFLEGLRALCDAYGTVLIFDEVLTGFRLGLGGAQAHFDVQPDIATLAKALGNGIPVAAICGKRDILEPVARAEVVIGGTYNGHPLAMAAVIATIEELERDDGAAFRTIDRLGTLFREGLLERAKAARKPLLMQGIPGAWVYTFTDRAEIRCHEDGRGFSGMKGAAFNSAMRQRGVLATARLCTSMAHTEDDIADALEIAEQALDAMPD